MSSESLEGYDSTDARLVTLEDYDLDMSAIERFLKSRDLRVPAKNQNFYLNVAEQLEEEQFIELIQQFKFAGRQTLNYFVITGISNFDLEEIADGAKDRFPKQGEVKEVVNKPFLADTERLGSRLYLSIGYYEYAGSVNPVTGSKGHIPITQRVVVVIRDDIDLIEVRGSDTNKVEKIRDEVCESIGKYTPSVKARPNMGVRFQEKFNELVESYWNLKVRVDDQEGSTLDTISFTSTEDEQGNRRDAREDDRVEDELSEGAEITMGYVELDKGFRFRLNREDSKISFTKAEREETLNQVTKIVDDVLRETGEYTQEQISGIEDVPE